MLAKIALDLAAEFGIATRECMLLAPRYGGGIRSRRFSKQQLESAIESATQDSLEALHLYRNEMVRTPTHDGVPVDGWAAFDFGVQFKRNFRTSSTTNHSDPIAAPSQREITRPIMPFSPNILTVEVDLSRRSPAEIEAVMQTLTTLLRQSVDDLSAVHGYLATDGYDEEMSETVRTILFLSPMPGLSTKFRVPLSEHNDIEPNIDRRIATVAWLTLLTSEHIKNLGCAGTLLRREFTVEEMQQSSAWLVYLAPTVFQQTSILARRFIEIASAILPTRINWRGPF